MGLKRKLISLTLAAALSVGFCGQALAADVSCLVGEDSVTFSDGAERDIFQANETHLIMVNGNLIHGLACVTGDTVYLPIQSVAEGLGFSYTENNDNTAEVIVNAATVKVYQGNQIIAVNDSYYDIGSPVMRINGELYAPIMSWYGSGFITVQPASVSPYALPLILIDSGVPYGDHAYATAREYRDQIVADAFSKNAIKLMPIYKAKDWFADLTTIELIEAKTRINQGLEDMKLVWDVPAYYYFESETYEIGALVNKFSGEYYVSGDGCVDTLENFDLSVLVPEE